MRAFKDLREFLQLLEAEKQLLRINEKVSLEPDLAAAGCALAQIGGASPALQFDNIDGYTNAQVVMNFPPSSPHPPLLLPIDHAPPTPKQFFNFSPPSQS